MTKREDIQKEALNTLLEELKSKKGVSAAISMGVGKTLIGLQHMKHSYSKNAKFLVVAPKKSILKSWEEEAHKFGFEQVLNKVTFSTYLSLNKQDLNFTHVYLDECHSLLPHHAEYLKKHRGKIIGLTGTAPREFTTKFDIVDMYCPVVYTYMTDEAVNDKILNDYVIHVHKLKLSTIKNFKVKLKKGQFYTSEAEHYYYWTAKLSDDFITGADRQRFAILRMQGLMAYETKETYVKLLLNKIKEKTLVFCNHKEQAEKLCKHTYHSTNSDSESNLEKFKSGEVKQLGCIHQLSEGVNIPDLKYGIILHSFSNERKTAQRIGRLLRLNPEETAEVHILMYENTVDEKWVSQALENFDSNKIIYHEQ